MNTPWLALYAPGTPATVELDPTTLPELLEQAFDRFAALPAFTATHAGGSTTLRYAEVERLSRAFAGWLHTRGLRPGQRIAVMLPNLLQMPVVLLGAWRAGLAVVNVNPQYTAREVQHQLQDAQPTAIVVLDTLLPLVNQVRAGTAIEHVVITSADDLHGATAEALAAPLGAGEALLREALSDRHAAVFEPVPLSADDLAVLQYTGGTTGVSKGAMLSHGNLVINVLQGAAWYGTLLTPGKEQVLTALPLYHVFALTFNLLVMMHFGAHNRLIVNPRDLASLQAALAAGCSVMSGVNTLYNALLNDPGVATLDLHGVKLAVSGGAATQPAVAARWLERTGARIVAGYGLTETSPFAMSNAPLRGHGSGLLPMPSTEVSVRDAQGHEVPPGQVGEIWVRGPQVMQGYWGRPEATAEAVTAGGWLRTGDLGVMDAQGTFSITDRQKDMVLVSGFNVYPNEVEAVLAEHPGVLESAVVGVPDERTGEAVKAFVVARHPGLTADDLIQHCRAQLAAYKVPRHVALVNQLPKSPVGKILRRVLRG